MRKHVRKRFMPAWWSGPWRIAEDCPSDRHHSRRAARGRSKVGERFPRCTCPRALAVWEAEQADLRVLVQRREQERSERVRVARYSGLPVVGPVASLTRTPDLSRGACQREPEKMEIGNNRLLTTQGILDRARAVEVCERCPLSVLRACRSWVKENEQKPGSWSGVWGGLDPWQRTGRRLVQDGHGIRVERFEEGGEHDIITY